MSVLTDNWMKLAPLQLSQDHDALCEEAEEVLAQLERCNSKPAQLRVLELTITERTVIAALDVAVAPILMPPNVLQLVKNGIVKACVNNRSFHEAGMFLDALEEGSFMSAAQAAEVMRGVQSVGRSDGYKWWHVVSRVIDKWNLSEKHHTQVACYYGCTRASMVLLLRDVALDQPDELQNRALSQVGRGDHTEYARSQRVAEFAAILIARNLRSGKSGDGSDDDTCAVCASRHAPTAPHYGHAARVPTDCMPSALERGSSRWRHRPEGSTTTTTTTTKRGRPPAPTAGPQPATAPSA